MPVAGLVIAAWTVAAAAVLYVAINDRTFTEAAVISIVTSAGGTRALAATAFRSAVRSASPYWSTVPESMNVTTTVAASGGGGGGALKQMMKPPRLPELSVDQVSRVPAGAALMLGMTLKAAVPDVVPGQYPFRAQLAQLGSGAPGAPGQMPGAYPEAVTSFMGGALVVAG